MRRQQIKIGQYSSPKNNLLFINYIKTFYTFVERGNQTKSCIDNIINSHILFKNIAGNDTETLTVMGKESTGKTAAKGKT